MCATGAQGEATGAQGRAPSAAAGPSCQRPPQSSRYFVGASGDCVTATFTDSPANQRNGMTAAPVGTWGEPRRQAVKRIAGVSVKNGFRSEAGRFWEWSGLERSASRTGEQRSGRLAERAIAGRARGYLQASCPDEVARAIADVLHRAQPRGANLFLAGRSLAAMSLNHRSARARSARTGTQ